MEKLMRDVRTDEKFIHIHHEGTIFKKVHIPHLPLNAETVEGAGKNTPKKKRLVYFSWDTIVNTIIE